MKIDYKKLFLLGFGFMGISVVWALYNADVPVILQSQFGMSNFATGWIMNIDNIFAVTLIPIIAAYSDKVSTKIGRRMPFIITGMPLMAVFFALVPWIPLLFGTSTTGLVIFMITVIVMNISAAVSRGPVIALMPDIVPPEQRSPANGGLVMIDYLQLMQGRGRAENRQQEISEISRSLKSLARELNVPVITLSQLSRAPETRSDHRPVLSDLRESGAIEQDADIVMFLYRDDYYHKDSEKKNIAEVIIAKHRNGPTGVVELLWLAQYTKFVSLDKYRTEEG